jgi:hypothetical protein
MINELKKALDQWFGDNGDDDQEEDFICGWVGAPNKHGTVNYDHGVIARSTYDEVLK